MRPTLVDHEDYMRRAVQRTLAQPKIEPRKPGEPESGNMGPEEKLDYYRRMVQMPEMAQSSPAQSLFNPLLLSMGSAAPASPFQHHLNAIISTHGLPFGFPQHSSNLSSEVDDRAEASGSSRPYREDQAPQAKARSFWSNDDANALFLPFGASFAEPAPPPIQEPWHHPSAPPASELPVPGRAVASKGSGPREKGGPHNEELRLPQAPEESASQMRFPDVPAAQLLGLWADSLGNAVSVAQCDAYQLKLIATLSQPPRKDIHLTVRPTADGGWNCGNAILDAVWSSSNQLHWHAADGRVSVWVRLPTESETLVKTH